MGLFGDLFGSSSHAQTTTSTSNVTNTQLAGGNIDAPTVYGTGNSQDVTVYADDAGTVQQATDISRAALELGAGEAVTGSAVAIAGLAHAQDAYTSSLAFSGGVSHDALTTVGDIATSSITGNSAVSQDAISSASANLSNTLQAVLPYAGKALDSVTKFSIDALDSNTYIAGKSLDSASAAYSSALGVVSQNTGDIIQALSSGYNTSLGQVNALAQQVSQSSQQSTDTTIQKVILYIAIAAAAVFILPVLAKK